LVLGRPLPVRLLGFVLSYRNVKRWYHLPDSLPLFGEWVGKWSMKKEGEREVEGEETFERRTVVFGLI